MKVGTLPSELEMFTFTFVVFGLVPPLVAEAVIVAVGLGAAVAALA